MIVYRLSSAKSSRYNIRWDDKRLLVYIEDDVGLYCDPRTTDALLVEAKLKEIIA